jgi:hypothetical protein
MTIIIPSSEFHQSFGNQNGSKWKYRPSARKHHKEIQTVLALKKARGIWFHLTIILLN